MDNDILHEQNVAALNAVGRDLEWFFVEFSRRATAPTAAAHQNAPQALPTGEYQ